jgi:phytoene synthase
VAAALKQVAATYTLPRTDFDAVIDGMQMDLDQQRYADFATLERYCERVAGAVGRLSARIFGYEDARTLDYARELGIAFQLTNIVRDVGEDASRGRIYLPQEDLSRFDASAQDIFARKHTRAFHALMQFQVERARAHYRRAFAALPSVDRRAQRPGLMMAAVYRALLDEIERDGFRVLDRRISLAPLYKAWVAWKASWSY